MIGDLQGCFEPLTRLLDRVRFDRERDRLWLVGDLVNRGPSSLEVLRFLYERRESVRAVLGNHDIYALARAHQVCRVTEDETLSKVMEAPDRDELLGWLGSLPLIYEQDGFVMVHAGLLPRWSLATARAEARAIESALSTEPAAFLTAYFRKPRPTWSDALNGIERAVAALAVLTRIRFVDAGGHMIRGATSPESPPRPDAVPWFSVAERASRGTPIVFGHWASLGVWIDGDVLALDSGCVWGGALTAVRLEDRAVFSVTAQR